jgi:hypothetical protein
MKLIERLPNHRLVQLGTPGRLLALKQETELSMDCGCDRAGTPGCNWQKIQQGLWRGLSIVCVKFPNRYLACWFEAK